MSSVKSWIKAFRLRTLPLSLSGIIFGSFIAKLNGFWDATIFVLALITTLFFQVLSNLANDLGDGIKGTDNQDRIGPKRAIQSGEISSKQMKFAVILLSVLSFLSATTLIYFGSENLTKQGVYFYLFLAIACIISAITYTVGKKAYGYNGFGDLFVFIFFGLVSVLGVYTLFAKSVDLLNLFPAISIGLLSTSVLNLNNMRDHQNDENSNKITLVVKMGINIAKKYHFVLISLSFISFIIFFLFKGSSFLYFSLIPFIFLFKHSIRVIKIEEEKDFDPELKKVALSTFFISVIFMILVLIK
jgi:1,4-dihydroxy-2-naphthoate polyprenyltransferase